MTWLELKNIIKTLGFEEDSALTEYQEIIINACNLSVSTINDTVVARLEGYFKSQDEEWEKPTITPFTTTTADDFVIEMPELVHKLVPYLAAYHVWLDDDERKAVYYYNVYNDLRDEIVDEYTRARTAKIVGGYDI
jgi:hypothetical protein